MSHVTARHGTARTWKAAGERDITAGMPPKKQPCADINGVFHSAIKASLAATAHGDSLRRYANTNKGLSKLKLPLEKPKHKTTSPEENLANRYGDPGVLILFPRNPNDPSIRFPHINPPLSQ